MTSKFDCLYGNYAGWLLTSPRVKVGKWHQMDVADNDLLDTHELVNQGFTIDVPSGVKQLQEDIKPNLPWAEDHFQERMSGEPLNPPPSSSYWPFAMQDNEVHKTGDKFSHTYPERMWCAKSERGLDIARQGIRYSWGDLSDLVRLLIKEPLTRQAYLPIWFPEDINAANIGERVPCSLGYHFLLRPPTFTVTYLIRSCDFVRHFRDDVYMAARLLQWVLNSCHPHWDFEGVRPETVIELKLVFHAMSLHCMVGDLPKIRGELNG